MVVGEKKYTQGCNENGSNFEDPITESLGPPGVQRPHFDNWYYKLFKFEYLTLFIPIFHLQVEKIYVRQHELGGCPSPVKP
jgi:hypothetical protein